MNRFSCLIPIFLLWISGACTDETTTEFSAGNLKCEYMKEAIVNKSAPRFSWELYSTQKGQWQTAWQVTVSDEIQKLEDGKGNVWDSGKRKGDQSFGVKWKGERLDPFKRYFWRVRVWDRDGRVSDWSETASFITGAHAPTDWKAGWIGDHAEPPLEYPLLYKHIGYLSGYTDNDSEEKWAQIDLGEPKKFNKIRAFPSCNNIRQVLDYYFPLAFRIQTSKDGNTWKTVAERDPAPTNSALSRSERDVIPHLGPGPV